MQGGGAAVQVLGDVARAVGRSEARRAGGWLRLWPRRRGVSWRNQARRGATRCDPVAGREGDGRVGRFGRHRPCRGFLSGCDGNVARSSGRELL